VLDGVNLTADSGTVTVIAGGNGSGKSTLLRMVVGASEPTSGRLRLRTRSVGYVPERLPAALRMTANQYVEHMGRLRGLSSSAAAARATGLFDRLQLRPGPDVPISTLSKGNNQKVALTQALLAEPELLVLDEPFSGLDAPAGAALDDLLATARDNGSAVLVSAHSTTVVRGADVTLVLDAGRLRAGELDQFGVVDRATWMELVLRAVTDEASVRDLPAVAGHEQAGGRLTVRTQDADAVLRVALTAGWSLVEARRADGAA
jgi:ABC-type multidrug transport system ATPase subunit